MKSHLGISLVLIALLIFAMAIPAGAAKGGDKGPDSHAWDNMSDGKGNDAKGLNEAKQHSDVIAGSAPDAPVTDPCADSGNPLCLY